MKKPKPYIIKIYKGEKDLTELDLELFDKLLGKDYDEKYEDYPETIVKGRNGTWEGEGDSAKIDDVIRVLEKMKSKGANYVEIIQHSDHHGYYFNGVDIHVANEQEIQEHLDIKNKQSLKKLEESEEELMKKLKLIQEKKKNYNI
jgi:hypothetical protein